MPTASPALWKRRRAIQEDYNREHGITPQGIKKAIKDITERVKVVAEPRATYEAAPVSRDEVARLIKELEGQMKKAAQNLEFERAALLRDRIIELRREFEAVEIITSPPVSPSRKGRRVRIDNKNE